MRKAYGKKVPPSPKMMCHSKNSKTNSKIEKETRKNEIDEKVREI